MGNESIVAIDVSSPDQLRKRAKDLEKAEKRAAKVSKRRKDDYRLARKTYREIAQYGPDAASRLVAADSLARLR